ncbi:uncharacterized protein [Typha angustifolia]|uniref:uncharacterized protein n=1 Tax=Typha angustifolia TaxID=59011 RepID=UPI003C2EAF29
MAHENRGIHVSAAMLLLLLGVAWSAAAARDWMQLSRAELARVAGYGEEPLSTVLVTGALLCNVCFLPGSHPLTSYVAGAKVAVVCEGDGHGEETKSGRAYATTDEYGEFTARLPSHLHAIKRLDEDCTVRVLRLPTTSYCQLGSRPSLKAIKPSSVGDGVRVYSTGTVRLYGHGHGHEDIERSRRCLKDSRAT